MIVIIMRNMNYVSCVNKDNMSDIVTTIEIEIKSINGWKQVAYTLFNDRKSTICDNEIYILGKHVNRVHIDKLLMLK